MNFGNKRKFFNYRPLVSAFLFMVLGIIFAASLVIKTTLFNILAIVSISLTILTIILKSILSKDKILIKIIIVFISFMLGFTLVTTNVINLNNQSEIKGKVNVTGSVSTLATSAKSGLWVLNLKNVCVFKDGYSSNIDGEVRVYLDEGDGRVKDFVLGEKVSLALSIKKSEYFQDGNTNFYLINKNISYIGFCSEDDIVSVGENNINIFDKIKNTTKITLDKFLSKEYSGLAYTMLFGDKANLDENIYESYSASGISHLLAVSGLHVGFLVFVVGIILSLFKANDKMRFIIITIVTFLYAFMCGFSVSVTRAFIMTVILLFSKIRKKKYDSLSGVSLAGLILLIWNPFSLFDVGFILSFSAVLSIVLFNGKIEEIFNKIFNKKLSSALTVSLSAGIGTFLPILMFFEKISLLSIITNIIVVPIASIAFMFMLPFVVIATIIEPFGVFIYMFEALMKIVTVVSQITGLVSFNIGNNAFIFSSLVMLILVVLCNSDYLFINRKSKNIISLCLLIVSISMFSLSFIC